MKPVRKVRRKPEGRSALLQALETASPGSVSSRMSDRLAYGHDASHYLLMPQAVVSPTGAAQVAALFGASTEHGVSLTFRSGGTSLSGQAGTGGVLVDTRRNFRDIEVLQHGAKVRVQPGATVRQVNARLSAYRRKLGPDPASESACTIGGVVANNSSGMACGTEFNTYNTLESAILVLPSGTVIDTSAVDADEKLLDLEPVLHTGLLRLRDRIRHNSSSRDALSRLYSIKNTMGYGLNSFMDHDDPIDILAHLVVGSEGTLAFLAEATFRTVPVKRFMATGLLLFDNLGNATGCLAQLVEAGFATIELLDSTSLRVAQRDPQASDELRSIDVREHAALLVEYQETSQEALDDRLNRVWDVLDGLPLTASPTLSTDLKTRDALWHIRKGLYATVAGARPAGTTSLLEDIAVPVTSLLVTCQRLVALFDKYGYADAVIFGHAKDGNIHFMLNESFNHLDRYMSFTEEMVELVLAQGGTLKAEHGTGRIMAPFVRRQYGDELYGVMQEVKRLCDPIGMLNPGVLLNEDPLSYVANLKTAPAVEEEVDRCVECGYCEPVCPSKDLTMTPRQRIVLRREMAKAEAMGNAELLRELQRDYQYDGIDTCAVDGMCQTACPVLIDTGELVKRLRSEQRGTVEQAGWKLAASNWNLATRVGSIALTTVKHFPPSLVIAGAKTARAVIGEDVVPLWGTDLPHGGTPRRPHPADNPRAVYFSACIGSMFGPSDSSDGVSVAFLELLGRSNVSVSVPDDINGLCCGTPWKSKGLDHGYDEMRARVLPTLWEASQQGLLPVVCDAASCTEGLQRLVEGARDEFPGLRILDAITFVDEVVMPGLSIRTMIESLALHPTCSSTRLGTNDALGRIAEAVAREVVIPDDWGCCAFAGDRGMLHPELTASATQREASALNRRTFTAYASTNRTCELGMTRATGQQFQHVLEILEQATRPVTPASSTSSGEKGI